MGSGILADFTAVGRALAAPARAAMLSVLLDGREHTATRLADAAGVSASTASGHLAQLATAGLVTAAKQGRFRRYRIASAEIAQALETLSPPPGEVRVHSLRLSCEQERIRAARTCYDHLAGQFGVNATAAVLGRNWVTADQLQLTQAGQLGFEAIGIDVDHVRRARRPLVRLCLDWTERRHHLAGGLGAALAAQALGREWVRRQPGSRGLVVTAAGRQWLNDLSSATGPAE
jgi:DNA-binding transcriptional ArsR family regulator